MMIVSMKEGQYVLPQYFPSHEGGHERKRTGEAISTILFHTEFPLHNFVNTDEGYRVDTNA
jgi:hypothetical protein